MQITYKQKTVLSLYTVLEIYKEWMYDINLFKHQCRSKPEEENSDL